MQLPACLFSSSPQQASAQRDRRFGRSHARANPFRREGQRSQSIERRPASRGSSIRRNCQKKNRAHTNSSQTACVMLCGETLITRPAAAAAFRRIRIGRSRLAERMRKQMDAMGALSPESPGSCLGPALPPLASSTRFRCCADAAAAAFSQTITNNSSPPRTRRQWFAAKRARAFSPSSCGSSFAQILVLSLSPLRYRSSLSFSPVARTPHSVDPQERGG